MRAALLIALVGCYVQSQPAPAPTPAPRPAPTSGGDDATGGFEGGTVPAPTPTPTPVAAPAPAPTPEPAPRGDGRDEVTMINVIGLPLDKAKAKLRAAGITGEVSVDGTGPKVCGTTPGPGRKTLGHLLVGVTMCGE